MSFVEPGYALVARVWASSSVSVLRFPSGSCAWTWDSPSESECCSTTCFMRDFCLLLHRVVRRLIISLLGRRRMMVVIPRKTSAVETDKDVSGLKGCYEFLVIVLLVARCSCCIP
jgi:hypothetical protein